MKRSGLLWGFLFCGICGLQAQNQNALQQLLQTDGLKQAAVGIAVKSVTDGKSILAYRSEMALTPASVTKLLPTWLALQTKGAKYRFQTSVCYSGVLRDSVLAGNLIIKPQGDPTLDSRYFPENSFLDSLLRTIKNNGIRRILGKVIVKGAQKGIQIPGSWPWEDVSNYYAALYLPFNYRDNTFTLQFRSGEPGKRVQLTSINPSLPDVKIENEVRASTDRQDNAWIFGGPYSTVLYVKGTIPANRSAFKIKGAIHDPAAVFVGELKAGLVRNGIQLEQGNFTDTLEKELISYYSPDLAEIVFHTNKSSINLFAEALGHLSGEENWPEKVKGALKQVGVDATGMILKDACGLSPMDAVPAQVFTDLLVYIGQQEQTVFLRSLPIAGVDGGLAGYCYASPELKNNLKAKTGSMSGVRCLAGYITRKNGEQLAFTVLINHYTCTTAQLQRAVGKFLSTLL